MMETKTGGIVASSDNGSSSGSAGRVRGYLSKFNVVDSVNDMSVPGAFNGLEAAVASGQKVPLLWAHEYKQPPIGVVKAMRQDSVGAFFVADLADSYRGEEMKELTKIGAVSGVSYSFDVIDKSYQNMGGKTVRVLKNVDVAEVSLCTFPALDSARLLDAASLDEILIAEYETLKACRLPVSTKMVRDYVSAQQRMLNRMEIQWAEQDLLMMKIEHERTMIDALRR